MNTIQLKYGQKTIGFTFPEAVQPEIIAPINTPETNNPIDTVEKALGDSLEKHLSIHSSTKTVSIAINDKTRPVPNHQLLPPLLKKLINCGIHKENIQFIIASGTHTPMRIEEFCQILPEEIIQNYKISAHNCDDRNNLQFIGRTSYNTPIWINKDFYNSDLKIVVGNIEPHHFMGFSGGVKSASIGLSGRETINTNHAMLLDENAAIGIYEKNPMRQDIEEIGKLIGVDFALNTILNQEKKIVEVVFGNPLAVMQAGIPISRKVCSVSAKQKYDLVIASVGGKPKDINLYQSQKALTHASLITKDGGVVILVAECPEGVGNQRYVDFMQGVHSVQEVFNKFKQTGFQVGPHKAIQFARELIRIQVILISNISPETIRNLLLIPADSPDSALAEALNRLPNNPSIAVLPYATNTLPQFQPIE